MLPDTALDALVELLAREDHAIMGIILTGSAARGMATKHSDVDVIVVRDEGESESAREVTRSSAIDEIPMTLAELETFKAIGFHGAWDRGPSHGHRFSAILLEAKSQPGCAGRQR